VFVGDVWRGRGGNCSTLAGVRFVTWRPANNRAPSLDTMKLADVQNV